MQTFLRKPLSVPVPTFTRALLRTAQNIPHSPESSLPDYVNPDEHPDWCTTPSTEPNLDFSTAFEISIAASFNPLRSKLAFYALHSKQLALVKIAHQRTLSHTHEIHTTHYADQTLLTNFYLFQSGLINHGHSHCQHYLHSTCHSSTTETALKVHSGGIINTSVELSPLVQTRLAFLSLSVVFPCHRPNLHPKYLTTLGNIRHQLQQTGTVPLVDLTSPGFTKPGTFVENSIQLLERPLSFH